MTNPSYDPASINWGGVLSTLEHIMRKEPRFASFAMRTFFHDSGTVQDGEHGADGTILFDDAETFHVRAASFAACQCLRPR